MGAHGATTLLYENKRFTMPGQIQDTLKGEKSIKKLILERLLPQDSDLIIISSADDKRTAELAAKYAALMTAENHHKHL